MVFRYKTNADTLGGKHSGTIHVKKETPRIGKNSEPQEQNLRQTSTNKFY